MFIVSKLFISVVLHYISECLSKMASGKWHTQQQACCQLHHAWLHLQQLEMKNRGQIGGLHGWNSALDGRPRVQAQGRGSFSSVTSPCQAVKLATYTNIKIYVATTQIKHQVCVLTSRSIAAHLRPYLWQLESKNRGLISGLRGWRNYSVRVPGHSSFSPVAIPFPAVKLATVEYFGLYTMNIQDFNPQPADNTNMYWCSRLYCR